MGLRTPAAVLDGDSRRGLCVEGLEHAMQMYSTSEIFNTDQSCQVTANACTGVLKAHGIATSMQGRSRGLGTSLRNGSGVMSNTKTYLENGTRRRLKCSGD